jgi:hypothetical protein
MRDELDPQDEPEPPAPRHRRKSDRHTGMVGKAVRVSESPVTVALSRLSNLAWMPVLGILAWFATGMVDDFRGEIKELADANQQILINQAVGISERDDQKRRLTKIEEGMTRLWQHVMGSKDN